MNIELDEVVVQDVSDEALEPAAGGAKGGMAGQRGAWTVSGQPGCPSGWIADR